MELIIGTDGGVVHRMYYVLEETLSQHIGTFMRHVLPTLNRDVLYDLEIYDEENQCKMYIDDLSLPGLVMRLDLLSYGTSNVKLTI